MRDSPDWTADDIDCTRFLGSLDTQVPAAKGAFLNIGTLNINPGWGVSITGATIGEVEEADALARFDTCLAHENSDGRYHYHFPSPCAIDSTVAESMKSTDKTLANTKADTLQKLKDVYKKKPYRSVFGLAKDGRPIYTPYYDNMKTYRECEVDWCNGINIGDTYAYVSTFFYPWYISCYGSGKVAPKDTHKCFPSTVATRSCDVVPATDDGSTQLKFIGAISLMFSSIYLI